MKIILLEVLQMAETRRFYKLMEVIQEEKDLNLISTVEEPIQKGIHVKNLPSFPPSQLKLH